MYAPGVWWTAAHHQIPLLTVMHNNRAYHQEVMHLQRMANRHNRGITRAHIGTTHRQSEHRLREDRAGDGRPRAGTDHQSERSRSGASSARIDVVKTRRAVAGRRRHAAAVATSDEGLRICGARIRIVAAFGSLAPTSSPRRQHRRPQRPAAAAPAGNAEDGRKLFVSYGCYQCHGYEAQGSSATGPRLGPRPIAFAAFSDTSGSRPTRCRRSRRRSCRMRTWPTSTRSSRRGRHRRAKHSAVEVDDQPRRSATRSIVRR